MATTRDRTSVSSCSSSASYYSEFGPPFADLPMEILVKIFTYLSASDRCVVGQTCQRWLEATQHTGLRDHLWLMLRRIPFDANSAPVSDLLRSCRSFPNIGLSEVDVERVGDFFQHFGPTIRRLELRSCEIQERDLYAILRSLPALRSLSIRSCRDLFMCVRLFEDPAERVELSKTLAGVTELRLTHNQYLSDAILHRMCEIMPALAVLDLSGCHISFHKGLYRKFYPGSGSDGSEPSESVLTFHYISRLIDERKRTLRALNFSETLIDDAALEVLAAMEPELQLDRLELNRCEQLSYRGLQTLLRVQTATLTELDLTKAYRMTDSCLWQICNELTGLRVLRLRGCRAISNQGARELAHLQALEVLDVSYCEEITGEGLLIGLACRPRPSLRELHIRALNLCERTIIALTENLPQLNVLDVGFCLDSVSDLCLQHIFRNLVRLTRLDLENCRKVTDDAMTGLGLGPLLRQQDPKSKPSPPDVADGDVETPEADENHEPPALVVPTAPPMRISIRSRAEQQIVEEAERKQRLMAVINRRSQTAIDELRARADDDEANGYSIGRLQQLRVLNLACCNQLTDVSLLCNFRLVELQQLSLAQCQQISVDGIRALVRNCPSLEQLDLSECHSLNDRAVEQITVHLKRLRTLSLRRCYQLTDFTLDHIALHARQLRMLDVRGCKHMCDDPGMRLVNLPLLATILPGRQDDYCSVTNFGGSVSGALSLGIGRQTARPAPPPPRMPVFI
ncbi:dynein regulatory complex subunit 6-like [Anopheles cruzii]|uniref:dynein regulatory complex subunit 6-like n=1 Tax=Anopheles cruzii TaxID=68878 RepID=UPI0022EC5290|nr:dynein regulatory complex subunit 6-like [Anopheles cruzii]